MSQNDETPSPIQAVASWIRRDGVAETGDNLRTEADQTRLAGSPSTPPPPTNHGPPPTTYQTVQTAKTTIATWGNNKQLTPDQHKRAVLEHLQALAVRQGKQVPQDILEFLEKAQVILLDANGHPVHVASVVIAWED
jgi:hypothetical protein